MKCGELYRVSRGKSILTDYISNLPDDKMKAVNAALRFALAV